MNTMKLANTHGYKTQSNKIRNLKTFGKNWVVCFLLGGLISVAASAEGPAITAGSFRQLLEKSAFVQQQIAAKAYQMDERTASHLLAQLSMIENTLGLAGGAGAAGAGSGSGPGPGGMGPPPPPHGPPTGPGAGVPLPPPVPAIQMAVIEATCHVDDDIDFTYDQSIVGTLRGNDLVQIQAQCLELAHAAYGAKGTAGLKNVQVLSAPREEILLNVVDRESA